MKKYEIVKDGKSLYHIIASKKGNEAEHFAASELQRVIYESTDVFVPYFSDRCERRECEIIIGTLPRDTYKKLDMSGVGDEGFIIKTLGDDIVIAGKTPRGTLYGVYSFMEKFMGYRCFRKDVEKIEKLDSIVIDEQDIVENPDFEYREAYFRFAFDQGFATKNKLNANLAQIPPERGGHMKFFNYHHSFNDLVPPEKYFEAHPEYYAEVNGERMPTQLCLSNPDVLKIAVDRVLSWKAENPHCNVFSVAQNDNDLGMERYCTCEKCRAVDEYEGSPAGSNIHFVNAVAREVRKVHPDVLIHTFAYQYTKKAPKHVRPDDNVIVRLCNIECDFSKPFEQLGKKKGSEAEDFITNMQEWTKICDRVYLWDYCVNFTNYLQPFPNIHAMAENIRFYKKNNIRGILEQGNFSYGGGAALDELKSYVIAKLLWDSSQDVDALIEEFTDYMYGKGGKYIRRYIKLITEEFSKYPFKIFDFPDSPYIKDDLFEKCEELFCKAEEAAENETVLERIKKEHLSIEYVRTVRIEDDKLRAEKTDEFAKKVKHFKLTEIFERRNLNCSFECMKNSRYALEGRNDGWMYLYYIMK